LLNSNNKMLKVLFLASWYPDRENPISGIFIKRQAHAVANYCEVAVLYVNIGAIDDCIEEEMEDGILTVRVYRRSKSYNNKIINKFHKNIILYIEYLLAGLAGYRIIKDEFGRPDLSQVNVINFSGLIGLSLDILYGIPYVITEHWAGYFEEDGGFMGRTRLGKRFMRSVGKRARAIIAVSKRLKEAMQKCGIINNYFVIPNVVQTGEIGRSCLGSSLIHQLSCNGKIKIIHISLLKDQVKNVSGIIEAVRILRQSRSDFELHIVGDGNDRKKLEELAGGYGLLDSEVFFHGLVDGNDVGRIIQSCDFSVINSNFETFSVSAAESLIWGKPVIATKCGGPEEFVDDKCGILVERNDVPGLVRAMEFMMNNYGKYNSTEISCYAASRFSYEVVGAEFLKIYKQVLNL